MVRKRLAETECKLFVRFYDMEGKEQQATINHDGSEDCWDAHTWFEEGKIDVAFDFNTFDGLVYGDDDKLHVNAYQLTKKNENGEWVTDGAVELEVISFEQVK